MKTIYKGSLVEGTVSEIKELLGGEGQHSVTTDRTVRGPRGSYKKRATVTNVTNVSNVDKRKGSMSQTHKNAIKRGAKRAWKNRRNMHLGAVVHRDIRAVQSPRGRESKIVSSKEVVNLFKKQKKGMQYGDVISKLQASGKIKKLTDKAKRAVSDRLYFLATSGVLSVKKKGHKNYYKLA